MARRIYGRIISSTNMHPLGGYRVSAYDHDDFDSDDFMGSDLTNMNGEYSINYAGGHWDPGPHQWPIWRPDIYLRVFAPFDTPVRWIMVWESGISGNWKLRNDLRSDAVVTPPSQLARSVSGLITWSPSTWDRIGSPGQPAAGLRVQAFDDDSLPDFDDYMGSDITANDGTYKIAYNGGQWDLASGGNWRPDIRIEVDVEHDGKWREVHKSVVFTNVLHAHGLVYNAEAHFVEPEDDLGDREKQKGTIWTIANGNPSLRVRFRVRDDEGVESRWVNLFVGGKTNVFVPDGEKRTIVAQVEVSSTWLYRTETTIAGSGPGITTNTQYIGSGGIVVPR